jgi:hypothetical protein
MEVAELLQEEQKADEVYTYKEGRGVDQFADAVAEAFKKAGSQIPRGGAPKHLRRPRAQEETGEEERPRRKSGGAVTPKYYAEHYKHIDKEARATKLIEVLTSEKPRVYKRCSGWTETRGTSRHGPIRGVRGQYKGGATSAAEKTRYDAPEPGMPNHISQALKGRWRARWDL